MVAVKMEEIVKELISGTIDMITCEWVAKRSSLPITIGRIDPLITLMSGAGSLAFY